MAKRAKTYNLFNKIRAALRDVYRYSPMRKEAIIDASLDDPRKGLGIYFKCELCSREWPIAMADVDHEPPLGPLNNFVDQKYGLGSWAEQLFTGNVQVICKLCHKKKTAQQQRKK